MAYLLKAYSASYCQVVELKAIFILFSLLLFLYFFIFL